jgi:hypothetical protein
MFTLDKNRRSESVLIYKSEIIDKVRRHESDYGSFEVKSKLEFFSGKLRNLFTILSF